MSALVPLHCMIEVRDLERSIRFYRSGFGFRELSRHRYPGHRLAFLGNAASLFELEIDQPDNWGQRCQQTIRTWHLGYGSVDIEAEHRRLTELGLEPEGIKDFEPDGCLMNRWFYLYDPDGYQIEIIEMVGRFAIQQAG